MGRPARQQQKKEARRHEKGRSFLQIGTVKSLFGLQLEARDTKWINLRPHPHPHPHPHPLLPLPLPLPHPHPRPRPRPRERVLNTTSIQMIILKL